MGLEISDRKLLLFGYPTGGFSPREMPKQFCSVLAAHNPVCRLVNGDVSFVGASILEASIGSSSAVGVRVCVCVCVCVFVFYVSLRVCFFGVRQRKTKT